MLPMIPILQMRLRHWAYFFVFDYISLCFTDCNVSLVIFKCISIVAISKIKILKYRIGKMQDHLSYNGDNVDIE